LVTSGGSAEAVAPRAVAAAADTSEAGAAGTETAVVAPTTSSAPIPSLETVAARLMARLDSVDERLANIERSTEDLRRREILAELRAEPSRLLAGIAEIRRVVPEDLDDLAEVLARWDVPLSPEDLTVLQQTALVAQGVSGARGAKVHLVVNVVSRVTAADLDKVTRAARILSVRSRRAIPVLVTLREPPNAMMNAAITRGVEIALDT
jgi:hypothetical protein